LLLSVLLCLPFPKLYKKQKESYSLWFIHLLKAKKQSKDVVFYLIGVHPDYQNKAVTAVIFSEYYHTFKARWKTVSVHLNLLTTIHNLWKHFNTEINCRRKLSG
jgi:hypothetical protein